MFSENSKSNNKYIELIKLLKFFILDNDWNELKSYRDHYTHNYGYSLGYNDTAIMIAKEFKDKNGNLLSKETQHSGLQEQDYNHEGLIKLINSSWGNLLSLSSDIFKFLYKYSESEILQYKYRVTNNFSKVNVKKECCFFKEITLYFDLKLIFKKEDIIDIINEKILTWHFILTKYSVLRYMRSLSCSFVYGEEYNFLNDKIKSVFNSDPYKVLTINPTILKLENKIDEIKQNEIFESLFDSFLLLKNSEKEKLLNLYSE